jgi:hypothetical protein
MFAEIRLSSAAESRCNSRAKPAAQVRKVPHRIKRIVSSLFGKRAMSTGAAGFHAIHEGAEVSSLEPEQRKPEAGRILAASGVPQTILLDL